MTLGDIIKTYRAEHGLSVRAFASRCGLSNTYLATLERGVSPRGDIVAPSVDTYRSIAAAMGITVNDLISQVDDLISLNLKPEFSDDEISLIESFRSIPKECQGLLIDLVASFAKHTKVQ